MKKTTNTSAKETKTTKALKKEEKAMKTNAAQKKVTATDVKKQATEKKARTPFMNEMAPAIEKDLKALGLEWKVNAKRHYIVKVKDAEGKTYAIKIAGFKKLGTYRIYCQKTTLDRLNLTEKQYEFHQGWAVPYTLNISMKEVLTALKKAAPKKAAEEKATA